MKRIALFALSCACWLGALTQPVMVGHRGSIYGVENTSRSFANGARMGYKYLETDVRTTADSVLVCSHDESIQRLGGQDLKIADCTLAELQAVPLAQKRRSLYFEDARLTTLDEYLDICQAQGVLPLIELKWGTGINSNDCSGIPHLIETIEKKGFRDSCIIITSMKPCLEYIRANYPDISLQFLTGRYWRNHYDWCKEQGIDLDIQAGYFEAADVEAIHADGLKVNVWTVNTPEAYARFSAMPVDYITTDFLAP